jgi:hypothetical protein
MNTFERIINLMGRSPSASLRQHCSAMRMDREFAYVFNQLNFALNLTRVAR